MTYEIQIFLISIFIQTLSYNGSCEQMGGA